MFPLLYIVTIRCVYQMISIIHTESGRQQVWLSPPLCDARACNCTQARRRTTTGMLQCSSKPCNMILQHCSAFLPLRSCRDQNSMLSPSTSRACSGLVNTNTTRTTSVSKIILKPPPAIIVKEETHKNLQAETTFSPPDVPHRSFASVQTQWWLISVRW